MPRLPPVRTPQRRRPQGGGGRRRGDRPLPPGQHLRPAGRADQQQLPARRSGGAAARAAAEHGVFVEYNDLLFEHQPTEGQAGFTVDELKEWFRETGASEEDAAAFDGRIDDEAATVTQFTEDYLPALTEDALDQLGQENLSTMVLTDLMAWGADNGHDPSFLDGTYTGEIIDATGNAYTRYSGDNAFRATPSVYINGELLDNSTTMTVRGLQGAIDEAGPGEVQTEPLTGGGGEE